MAASGPSTKRVKTIGEKPAGISIPGTETRAVRNSRVCYSCALPIHDEATAICPRCGGQDIDQRRARPERPYHRESVQLPHPWDRLTLRRGGTVLLSGGPGSGKSTICMAIGPARIMSSEQEVEEVASIWFRVNQDRGKVPVMSSCTSWQELEEELNELGPGDIGVVDSISQLASGPGTAYILRRAVHRIRAVGAMAVFIAQYTKDGDMLGPNELRHLVDVVSSIPDDPTGLRRLSVSKNRFGNLFSTYFSLGEHGVLPQEFRWAYSVEGPPGRYSLHLYPMGGAKFTGILEALENAGHKISAVACAAVASSLYDMGFVEPDDVFWRKRFAEDHGLSWIDPPTAWKMIEEKSEEGV